MGGCRTKIAHCVMCGRELEWGERCDCGSVIGVKDGLRARCPYFRYRSSYFSENYIVCGIGGKRELRVRIHGRELRDRTYAALCCKNYDSCERYKNIVGGLYHGASGETKRGEAAGED